MKIKRSIQLRLSCYCCGGVDFENTEKNWNKVENMYFLNLEDKERIKCLGCGLENYLHNLVPRGFTHEELVTEK